MEHSQRLPVRQFRSVLALAESSFSKSPFVLLHREAIQIIGEGDRTRKAFSNFG